MVIDVLMRTVDQDGNDLDDELSHAAIRVYNKAGELFINDLLIPNLNDCLYAGKEFPLDSESQGYYEEAGEDMFAAAYKFTAYMGYGRCGNQLVYPSEVLTFNEKLGTGLMRCVVKPLWKEDA